MIARVVLLGLGLALLAGCSGDQGQAAPEQNVRQNKAHQALEDRGG